MNATVMTIDVAKLMYPDIPWDTMEQWDARLLFAKLIYTRMEYIPLEDMD